jgi:hypothetical protein
MASARERQGALLVARSGDDRTDGAPTVEGRERIVEQVNRRVHEHPRYQRLPHRAQMFLAGYISRCQEERFGVGDSQPRQIDGGRGRASSPS